MSKSLRSNAQHGDYSEQFRIVYLTLLTEYILTVLTYTHREPQTQIKPWEAMQDMVISMTAAIVSQCVSNHRMGQLRYIQFVFVDHTSVKLGKGILLKKKKSKAPIP